MIGFPTGVLLSEEECYGYLKQSLHPEGGPDPCWWTFIHFQTNGNQPCQEHVHHTHRSSGTKSSNWLETDERCRIWPKNLNQRRQPSEIG